MLSYSHHIGKWNEGESLARTALDGEAGCRRGRSTADLLITLQVIIEKRTDMDNRGWAFVLHIDYSKEFDSISQV